MDAVRKSRLCEAGVNVDHALERFMGNEKMLEKYLGRFLTEKSYAALVDAMAANDHDAAKAAVHTLKSVCGTIGCEGMQEQVLEQEKQMRADAWDAASAMMPQIQQTYAKICAALQG